MGFWITAGALTVLVCAALAVALRRGAGQSEPAAAYDLRIYRDQLAEIDRDVARGVIGEAEAERARAEVSRRILAADQALAEQSSTGGKGGGLVSVAPLAGLVLVIAVAAYVYLDIGSPGYPDLPLERRIAMIEEARAARPSQFEAESQVPPTPPIDVEDEVEAAVAELRTVMENRPDDPEGWQLLARYEARLGNYRAARLAQERLVALTPEDERTARLWTDYAIMMAQAAGGYFSPEAEEALNNARALDPDHGPAGYFLGLLYAQQSRPDLAFSVWLDVLRTSAPGDPWVADISREIEQLAFLAGQNFDPAMIPAPAAPGRGPTREQVEAAGDMTPAERMVMIENMVAGLSDRLATEGGPPEDWARLIQAYLVLGDAAQAQAIYDEAQRVFAGAPEALALFEEVGAALAGAGAE